MHYLHGIANLMMQIENDTAFFLQKTKIVLLIMKCSVSENFRDCKNCAEVYDFGFGNF
jgi:hypothetical protein